MTTDAAAYPIQIELDYPEHQSRIITFFRYLLALPHFLVLMVVMILAAVAIVISFFVVLITGRYPAGLHAFVSGSLRYMLRVMGYTYLLTSRYPPFSLSEDPNYPIRIHYQRPEKIGRLHVFNFILAIPMVIVLYAIQIVNSIVVLVAWLVALIIGRNPRALWDVTAVWLSWQARLSAYILWLTDRYPPLTWG